jgi:6-phosphogluconate dehydrogenase
MGGNMTQRLVNGGHTVVAYDRTAETVQQAASHGALASTSLEDVVSKLTAPRAIWVMVPSGDPTESTLNTLADHLAPGDILIDGGNSNYKDSVRRGAALATRGIHFVDVGTSGGVWGLQEGYSMMIGGEPSAVERLTPIFQTLAPASNRGWGHVGPVGSGHFTKMIHNGIEYAMMQAYAEGFEILRAKEEFALDLHQIAEIWRHGSVVRSWLLDLTANALSENPDLDGIKGWVADSGEGRWTVFEAIDQDVPAPTITHSLMMRFISRQEDSFGAKLLAAMRNQFGGHAVKKE